MKKSILLLIVGLTVLSAKAQQIPLYTQYYNNEFLYNPSQTLTEDYSSLDLFYRKQWISSNSPLVTQGIVFQTPILTEKIGLGVSLINDKFGIFNRTGAAMAYSYKVDLNMDHKLLLGLSVGFMNTNYDWNSDISLLNDPRFVEAITDRVTNFDATFGFTYQWKALEVGVAVPHLLDKDLDFTVDAEDLLYFNQRHYVGNISYNVDVDKFNLRPLLLVRYQPAVSPLFDLNLVTTYDDKYWAALGYRYEGAMTFGAGVNLHQRLRIGYSYDMNLNSDLNKYFGATHEITLGVRFGAGTPTTTPPKIGTIEDPVITPGPSLEDLQKQIDELKKGQAEQDSTLEDHESRIEALENKMEQDSLQKTIENILLNEAVGSGSYDYRGNEMTVSPGGRQIVNPTGAGRFGFDETGNEIEPTSNYKGTVFYDKEGTRPVADPQNPDVDLYDTDGNLIEDPSTYNGPIKDVRGNVIKDKKGNVIVLKSNEEQPNNPNGGGSAGGVNPGTGGSVNPAGTTPNVPTFAKAQLVSDGIRYTAPGNYVVVGSFRNKDYAIQLREKLQENGYSAGIVYNHYRKWFYVYSLETDNFDQALEELRKEQEGSYDDAWLHVIIE